MKKLIEKIRQAKTWQERLELAKRTTTTAVVHTTSVLSAAHGAHERITDKRRRKTEGDTLGLEHSSVELWVALEAQSSGAS